MAALASSARSIVCRPVAGRVSGSDAARGGSSTNVSGGSISSGSDRSSSFASERSSSSSPGTDGASARASARHVRASSMNPASAATCARSTSRSARRRRIRSSKLCHSPVAVWGSIAEVGCKTRTRKAGLIIRAVVVQIRGIRAMHDAAICAIANAAARIYTFRSTGIVAGTTGTPPANSTSVSLLSRTHRP